MKAGFLVYSLTAMAYLEACISGRKIGETGPSEEPEAKGLICADSARERML